MSDLTTYRLETGHVDEHHYADVARTIGYMERDKVLVPDTRLQAIADAPRCVHGNIYPYPKGKFEDEGYTIRHCVGAPKLAALLDALKAEGGNP